VNDGPALDTPSSDAGSGETAKPGTADGGAAAGPPPPGEGRRNALLLVATFAGTLLVLLGLAVVGGQVGVGPLAASPTVAPPSAAAPVPASSGPPPSPSASTPLYPVLAGAGEIASCAATTDEATADLLDEIQGTVFTTGDNVIADGTLDEFRACYRPSWGRHAGRTRPAPGEQEYAVDGAADYTTDFGAAAAPEGTTWYSYDLDDWHVVVLDSNCDELDDGCASTSPQLAWLRDDLSRAGARCTIAFWHHPRFSSAAGVGDEPAVGAFWDELHAAGAEIVVTGRARVYERFSPQNPGGAADPAAGIRQFVVGTGGAPLGTFGEPRPNSQVRASTSHGVLAISLRPGSYTWRFHAVDGVVDDQGSGACH
jgi:hypothetical protein